MDTAQSGGPSVAGHRREGRRAGLAPYATRAALITFVHPDGTITSYACPPGDSVRDVAVDNDIEEIIGDCGGKLVCATCHVYVESGLPDAQATPSRDERELLEFVAAERRPNSRLGCQLVPHHPAELVVRLPPEQ